MEEIISHTGNLSVGSTEEESNGTTSQGATRQGGGADQDDWVDLGLPSGLLWAKCNVGATKPEEYGCYFAWSETHPRNEYYTEHRYYWSDHGYGSFGWDLTKYCNKVFGGHDEFTDDLTTLEASDDAATVALGNGARTPTADEWRELIDNCTSEWSTKNGVCGRCFTGRNGNSIFLPAAGGRYSLPAGHHLWGRGDTLNFAGVFGYYWSSSLCTDWPINAWNFLLDSAGACMYDDGNRDRGFSVRPVRSAH